MRCFRNTKKLFLVPQASWKIHFLSTKAKHFIGQFITADDSKCRCAHSGMSGQMGGFHNPGFVCKRFLTFLSHPLPALVLAPFFARSLTLFFKTARKRLLRRLSGQRTFSTEYWGLKSNDATATRTSLTKWICVLFTHFVNVGHLSAVSGQRVRCLFITTLISSYFCAWPTHSARLAFAISVWLCSLFFTTSFPGSLSYCLFSQLFPFNVFTLFVSRAQ